MPIGLDMSILCFGSFVRLVRASLFAYIRICYSSLFPIIFIPSLLYAPPFFNAPLAPSFSVPSSHFATSLFMLWLLNSTLPPILISAFFILTGAIDGSFLSGGDSDEECVREGGCAGCRVGDKMICTSADTGTIRPLIFLQLSTFKLAMIPISFDCSLPNHMIYWTDTQIRC